jgi:FimV-like protein
LPDIKITVEGILTVFLILFVIGYISDKFINLELQIKMLNKKIKELNSHAPTQIQDNSKSDEEMKEIARDIKSFLENLAQSITSNQALPIRSKKIRRASSESIKNETTETLVNSSEQDTEIVSTTSDCITNTQTDISSVEDDNISKVDLARALIESDEKEKAKEVLKDIIKNGSASDAHEARILNLQIS